MENLSGYFRDHIRKHTQYSLRHKIQYNIESPIIDKLWNEFLNKIDENIARRICFTIDDLDAWAIKRFIDERICAK